ncbi:uncharacterized protein LOC131292779 [Anopheles ziemanni]|uniref:uncharacterized protein LOC131271130 n=1 Tax=Anopheles coustani TaxID=139045 RepID=UPI0026584287|nr:uncharacterized protein LOC131271130 [Anopheles coustani]XP_058176846.1 uncharacterized protein LOC131292779 [Anopheles ziemanni]
MALPPSTSRPTRPTTSGFTQPTSMAQRANMTPLAELQNWAREVRSSQGTPVQQTSAKKDPVEEVLVLMEACFDSLVNKMVAKNASNATAPPRLVHPSSTAFEFREAVRNQAEASPSYRNVHSGSPVYGSTAVHELTRSQLSARQAVPRELPPFSGRLEDWPTFLATYEETTNLCGFSPSENVIRLRQALSGRALKAVECRLRRAEDLQEALASLKEMYGRPEHLIDTLLAKIRRAPPLKEDRLDSLLDFAISVEEICATVRGSAAEHRFDGPVLRELVELLPWHLKIDWGRYCVSQPSKTLGEFGIFMRQLKSALLHVVSPSPQPVEKRAARHVSVHTTSDVTPKPPKTAVSCICDDGCKTLVECWGYWQLEVPQRWTHVRSNGNCRSCLKMHKGPCRDSKPCGRDGCTAKHHRSLHDGARQPNQREHEAPKLVAGSATAHPVPSERKSFNLHSTGAPTVMLRYVPVTVYGHGKCVDVLACLDEGSSITLMEHTLMEELGLKGSPKPLCLSWTGGQTREEESSAELSITVSGSGSAGKRHELPAVRTVRSLALPPQTVNEREIVARYQHLRRVPVQSYQWESPRLLIGIDNYRLSCPLKTVEGAPHEPVATKTRLGWVVSGICAPSARGSDSTSLFLHHVPCSCNDLEQRVDEAMKGSFALEEGRATRTLRSKADEQALNQLKANTKRIGGRYVTSLLWRYEDTKLPGNRSMALRRLDCLEKRMVRDETLRGSMNQIIDDYIKKGYVRKLSESEKKVSHPRKWYLPIFPVTNPNKPHKVRVVWDAAAAVNGVSLNSTLLTGPDLLVPLSTILQKFREYRVAVAADITEMFHQVCIREEDQHSQRFLWRWSNEQTDPDEYVMTRMTFGAACSPSCAQYVKNANADRFANQFPRAAKCIQEEHYVDDMLASLEDAADAVKLCRDVEYVHGEGGFRLHNWLSNSVEVRAAVGECETQEKLLSLEHRVSAQKVLGMWWDIETDTFRFKLPKRDEALLKGVTVPTKRQVLSVLMSIFDPLGIIAGFLFYLKVLLQDIWRTKIGWDTKIPAELDDKWKEWLGCLPQLEDVSIPRCYRQLVQLNRCKIQLHVFVDAGRDGFTAVAYFRFEQEGTVEVALVGGKTSVAPLKYSSVPRMELQAATVGTRIATSIAKAHREKITERVFWTDSKDVICWINSDHRRYSTFVAQRVGEIAETTNTDEWRWVPTKLNVADEGTKWSKLKHHLSSSSWFTGPTFLSQAESDWPSPHPAPETTDEEKRETVAIHESYEPLFDVERFSRWWRLIRAAAFVWRFIHNTRNPSSRRIEPLTPAELLLAEKPNAK